MNIFPIYYFPPIPWFALAIRESNIVLEVQQYYRKQQLTNRTYIKTANGILPLIIPVGRKGKSTKIWEKNASRTHRWKEIHWRSISHAYKNSAYFTYYEDRFRLCFENDTTKLVEILIQTIEVSLKSIGKQLVINPTKTFSKTDKYRLDFREAFFNYKNYNPNWFNPVPYYQVFGEFESGLSILDLIFNAGPESKNILLNSIQQEHFKQTFGIDPALEIDN